MKKITYYTYDGVGIFTFRARNGVLFDKGANTNALFFDLKKNKISQLRTVAGNLGVPNFRTLSKSQLVKACESRIKFKNGTEARIRQLAKKRSPKKRSSRKRVSKKRRASPKKRRASKKRVSKKRRASKKRVSKKRRASPNKRRASKKRVSKKRRASPKKRRASKKRVSKKK